MNAPATRRLGHYGYALPTGDDIRNTLSNAIPREAADIWMSIAAELGLGLRANLLEWDQLEAVIERLLAMEPVVANVGRDIDVRLGVYRGLMSSPEVDRRNPADSARRSLETLLRSRVSDPGRLEVIAGYDLFSENARLCLDETAGRVARQFRTKQAAVSVLLNGAQCFAGSYGMQGWMAESGGIPIEWSLCSAMVRTKHPLTMADSQADVLQRTNPLMRTDAHYSYAGAPLIAEGSVVIGSVCVFNDEARDFTEDEQAQLRSIADGIVAELETNIHRCAAP